MKDSEVFNQMESDGIREIGYVPPTVKKDLDGSIKLLNLISQSLELYLTRFFDAFSVIISGAGDRVEQISESDDPDSASFVDAPNEHT